MSLGSSLAEVEKAGQAWVILAHCYCTSRLRASRESSSKYESSLRINSFWTHRGGPAGNTPLLPKARDMLNGEHTGASHVLENFGSRETNQMVADARRRVLVWNKFPNCHQITYLLKWGTWPVDLVKRYWETCRRKNLMDRQPREPCPRQTVKAYRATSRRSFINHARSYATIMSHNEITLVMNPMNHSVGLSTVEALNWIEKTAELSA